MGKGFLMWFFAHSGLGHASLFNDNVGHGQSHFSAICLLTVVWAMLEPFQCDCWLTEIWDMGKAFSVWLLVDRGLGHGQSLFSVIAGWQRFELQAKPFQCDCWFTEVWVTCRALPVLLLVLWFEWLDISRWLFFSLFFFILYCYL